MEDGGVFVGLIMVRVWSVKGEGVIVWNVSCFWELEVWHKEGQLIKDFPLGNFIVLKTNFPTSKSKCEKPTPIHAANWAVEVNVYYSLYWNCK